MPSAKTRPTKPRTPPRQWSGAGHVAQQGSRSRSTNLGYLTHFLHPSRLWIRLTYPIPIKEIAPKRDRWETRMSQDEISKQPGRLSADEPVGPLGLGSEAHRPDVVVRYRGYSGRRRLHAWRQPRARSGSRLIGGAAPRLTRANW